MLAISWGATKAENKNEKQVSKERYVCMYMCVCVCVCVCMTISPPPKLGGNSSCFCRETKASWMLVYNASGPLEHPPWNSLPLLSIFGREPSALCLDPDWCNTEGPGARSFIKHLFITYLDNLHRVWGERVLEASFTAWKNKCLLYAHYLISFSPQPCNIGILTVVL